MLLAITDADARALVSVFGALLAAFGFFYTGTRDEVRAGIFGDPKGADDSATRQNRMTKKGFVRKAFWPGMVVLALSSCVIVGLMFVPIVDTVTSIDADESYSPSKAAFAALGVFWLWQVARAAYRLLRWP